MKPASPDDPASIPASSPHLPVELKVARGQGLFHQDDEFKGLYIVQSGLFKSVSTARDGRVQITGFQMRGDLLGLDRSEIGNYLGLTLETVSRTLSALASAGSIGVRGRHIVVLDTGRLERSAGSEWPRIHRQETQRYAGIGQLA